MATFYVKLLLVSHNLTTRFYNFYPLFVFSSLISFMVALILHQKEGLLENPPMVVKATISNCVHADVLPLVVVVTSMTSNQSRQSRKNEVISKSSCADACVRTCVVTLYKPKEHRLLLGA